MKTIEQARDRAGFVLLVEIALALMVFSMGVLASLRLMARGVERRQSAREHRETAAFGEGVIEGLSALAANSCAVSNGWDRFWTEFAAGRTGVPVVCAAFAFTNERAEIMAGGPFTSRLAWARLHSGDPGGIPWLTVRHEIILSNRPTAGGRTNIAVWLKLWEGEFGRTNLPPKVVFYSEIAREGGGS
ncbi:MAG: hypothetical protein FJ224_09630 [Lentisphaerae bacterium]|nr:hypothetical protein [Lentisphaerota bacterium]